MHGHDRNSGCDERRCEEMGAKRTSLHASTRRKHQERLQADSAQDGKIAEQQARFFLDHRLNPPSVVP